MGLLPVKPAEVLLSYSGSDTGLPALDRVALQVCDGTMFELILDYYDFKVVEAERGLKEKLDKAVFEDSNGDRVIYEGGRYTFRWTNGKEIHNLDFIDLWTLLCPGDCSYRPKRYIREFSAFLDECERRLHS